MDCKQRNIDLTDCENVECKYCEGESDALDRIKGLLQKAIMEQSKYTDVESHRFIVYGIGIAISIVQKEIHNT